MIDPRIQQEMEAYGAHLLGLLIVLALATAVLGAVLWVCAPPAASIPNNEIRKADRS
jgi:hypothetical protein